MKKHLQQLFSGTLTLPAQLQQSHLRGLDGLRAVAIIIVLLGHFFINTTYVNTFIGGVGVEIFFVISGFLITSLLLKEKLAHKHVSLKRFYIRRCLKILPPALLFLLTVAILNYFLNLGVPGRAFLSSLFFVQNLPVVSTYNWYIEHFWSLSVEEQFYIVFPFLLVYNIRLYTKTITLLIIGVVIIELLGFNKIGVFYTSHAVHILAFVIINLFGNFIFILIGSLFSIMLFKGFFKPKSKAAGNYLSLGLFVIALLIRVESSWFFIPYSRLLLFPLLIGAVIILNLNNGSIFTKILSNKVLVYIGKISYSIYLWQQLFSNPATWLVKYNSVALHLLIIFAVAAVSYHFYEKLFLNLKNKLAP